MANPNPSPETRFTSSGNPAGKTSEAKKLELLNAEAAMRIRARILEAVERQLLPKDDDPDTIDKAVLAFLDSNTLKLLTDSETRGLGAPVQPINHSGKVDLTPTINFNAKPK